MPLIQVRWYDRRSGIKFDIDFDNFIVCPRLWYLMNMIEDLEVSDTDFDNLSMLQIVLLNKYDRRPGNVSYRFILIT